MAEDGGSGGAAEGGGGGFKGAMTRKLGPLPVAAWIAIAVAILWYMNKGKGAGGEGGPQTDPAGNVGTINPQTGYVYGSTEDQSSLGSGSGSIGSSTDPGSTGGSTVAGQYEDNSAWAVAAINYLVSIGVDATSANAAITQFLASQTLTTQQQADVNLAIQRLGAPPSPPEPGGAPPPIVTPPSTSTYATNPPTGLTTTSVSTTSVGLKWNKAVNAKAYTVSWGSTWEVKDGHLTSSTPSATVTGLKPNSHYNFRVQATPAKPGAGAATLSKSTAKATSGSGGSSSGGSSGGSKDKAPYKHTVTKDGESFSSVAQQYHYKPGGHALWVWNYTSSPHSTAAKKKIKDRGPNLIVHGETIYVPRS
jgi:hypothetical protein